MKAILDKLDGLTEALRSEYKQEEDGLFHLKLEGLTDGNGHIAVQGLVRAKEQETAYTNAAKEELRIAKEASKKAKDDLHARLAGKVDKSDYDALSTSWEGKLAEEKTAHETERTRLANALAEATVGRQASEIANAEGVAVTPAAAKLLTGLLVKRLKVEIDADGHPVTKVLDKNGKPSATAFVDFQKEVVADSEYAPLLLGTGASGSGTPFGREAPKTQPSGTRRGGTDWINGNPADVAKAAVKLAGV
jgi:hypothetical protein